jgi:formylglycine-generating enzyme required for sulfatase activity
MTRTNSFGRVFRSVPGLAVLVAESETSIGDFTAIVGRSSGIRRELYPTDQHPAVNISWRQATNYASLLTLQDRRVGLLRESEHYRLPLDREWTQAAGLTNAPSNAKALQWWQSGQPIPTDANWYGAETRKSRSPFPRRPILSEDFDDRHPSAAPVDSFGTNAFGLRHIPGNISEWVDDEPDEKGIRWARGANWEAASFAELNVYRHLTYRSNEGHIAIGFRLVLVTSAPTDSKPASRD